MSLSQLWKRNAVVAAIALFVCAAVYLNWNYEQETAAGKTLGESTMVDGQTEDPLVGPPALPDRRTRQRARVRRGRRPPPPTATSPLPASTASRPGTAP